MARKERNPIKTMMIANLIIGVAIIGILIFWAQKTDGNKVGRFIPKSNEEPVNKEAIQLEVI